MRFKPIFFLLFPALVVINNNIESNFLFFISLVALVAIVLSYDTIYIKDKDGTEKSASILSLILSKFIR